ncbi:MAG: hypothetical protein JWN49_65 [Parcubacteria group bacterium]|nr:hypothetical protein [Parcubacteria group bacterium]
MISSESPSQTPHTSKSLTNATIIAAAVAVIISAVAYTPLLHVFRPVPNDQYLVSVTLPNVTRSYLYTYNPKPAKDASPYYAYMVKAGDKELPVLDLVSISPTESYYLLLEDASSSVSNIYKDVKGSVTRLTTSATPKRGMSVDTQSGALSFQSPVTKGPVSSEWETVIFNPSTSKEQLTGLVSFRSVLLSGGNALFLVGSTSVQFATSNGTGKKAVLPISGSSLVAFSIDASKIAVYNAVTHGVDSYTYSSSKGISFDHSSTPLPADVHAIAYAGNDILAVYKDISLPTNYVIKNLTTDVETSRLLVGPTLIPDRIKIDHE